MGGSMAHDQEHTDRVRSSKKLKNNKVPQRGMGVAQLEKIITEQQLKDAGVSTPNSVKFPLPEIPLPPRFPPNRFPLVSKSRLYNFDGDNPNPYPYPDPGRDPLIWQQFHAQRSSMVNVSLGATSSSSVMSIQIEPPSNQSNCANKHTSFQPDGDKMVGMKRSYPFSIENIPPAYLSPVLKPDESTTFRRGNPSSLDSIEDQKTKKFIDENVDLTKDFLTLAPPQISPLKEKLLPLSIGELTRPFFQGQTRDSAETEWSKQQPLHSFFPAAKTDGTSNGEVGEHVDLNLKL